MLRLAAWRQCRHQTDPGTAASGSGPRGSEADPCSIEPLMRENDPARFSYVKTACVTELIIHATSSTTYEGRRSEAADTELRSPLSLPSLRPSGRAAVAESPRDVLRLTDCRVRACEGRRRRRRPEAERLSRVEATSAFCIATISEPPRA